LYAAGVRRFCFENVWAYRAPLQCSPDELPGTPAFVFDDPARYRHGDSLPPEVAVPEELAAFDEGHAAFMSMLEIGGYEVRRGPIS